MPPTEAQIYALCEPTGKVRYIGKADNAKERFKSHLREINRKDTRLYRWIRKRLGQGIIPTLKIIRICPHNEWPAAEIEEIAKERAINPDLLNLADGGIGAKSTPEQSARAARFAVASRDSTPRKKRLNMLKRYLMVSIKKGYASEKVCTKMRNAARIFPSLACFATI